MRISGPSRESVNEARKHIIENTLEDFRHVLSPQDHEAIDTLLSATALPPDVPRPADMAELARLVAVELRHRGVPAFARVEGVIIWRLVSELAAAHGVDAETIVRAAVTDFAYGRSKGQQADAIRVTQTFDAARGDEKRHSVSEAVTKNVTVTNPR